MGRRIYRNIKKAMLYLISVHIPIAGITLLPILINKEMFLLPIHIVLMELIIDPMASIVFEMRNDKGLMKNKPRPKNQSLFVHEEVIRSMGRGLLMLSGSVIVYAFFVWWGGSEVMIRRTMFGSLIFGNLVLAWWYMNEKVAKNG